MPEEVIHTLPKGETITKQYMPLLKRWLYCHRRGEEVRARFTSNEEVQPDDVFALLGVKRPAAAKGKRKTKAESTEAEGQLANEAPKEE